MYRILETYVYIVKMEAAIAVALVNGTNNVVLVSHKTQS